MTWKKLLAILALNTPLYASERIYLWIDPPPPTAGSEWLMLMWLLLAIPLWLVALGWTLWETWAYVLRVRAGSREAVYPLLLAWLIDFPFGWLLADALVRLCYHPPL